MIRRRRRRRLRLRSNGRLHILTVMRAALNSDNRQHADKFWPRMLRWNKSPKRKPASDPFG